MRERETGTVERAGRGESRKKVRGSVFRGGLVALVGAAVAPALQDAEPAAGDETARPLARLERLLARHKYFSRVAWKRVDDWPGFALYVQELAKSPERHVEQTSRFYGPHLVQLAEIFEREVARPAGLERRADRPVVPVIVLASSGDYENYGRLGGGRSVNGHVGHWDERLDAVVTYRDVFAVVGTSFHRRFPALREAVVGLLRAHRAPGVVRVDELWLETGLAGYLAFHLRDDPEDLEEHHVEDWALRLLREILADPVRARAVLALEGLMGVRDYAGFYALPSTCFGAAPSEQQRRDAWFAFERSSRLWVRFFLEGADGSYRARFLRHVKRVLEGGGGAAALRESLVAASFDGLEAEHRAWLDELCVEVLGGSLASAEPSGAGAPDGVVAPRAEEAFTPARLAPDLSDPRDRLAAALGRARTGALAAAAELLDPARLDRVERDGSPGLAGSDERGAGAGGGGPAKRDGAAEGGDSKGGDAETGDAETGGAVGAERCARERARLEALRAARDGWLARLAAEKGRLRLEVEGRRIAFEVAAVEDGIVRFAKERAGLAEIALDALPPGVVAEGLARSDAAPWLVAYAELLAGEPRKARALGAGAEASALRADAGRYAELAAEGDALEALARAARLPAPSSAAEAEALLAALAELADAHGARPCVVRARGERRACAELALRVLFDARGVAAALHGEATELGEGRLRVRYAFDDAAEAADFVQAPEYLEHRREGLGTAVRTGVDAHFDVVDGRFAAEGAACVRHALGFAAPLRARFRLVYEQPNDVMVWGLMAGVCATAEGDYVTAVNCESLEVRNGPVYQKDAVDPPSLISPGRVFEFELAHDGEGRVSLWRNGERTKELPAHGLAAGWVFFWVHCDYEMALVDLEIEGTVVEESVEPLRRAWVERELAARGLD